MLYLLLAIAIGIGATVYLIKKGKIKDADGDFIPDVIEDKVEDIKEDIEDVIEDVKEFVEEVKDLPAKVTRKKPGPKRTSRKPAAKQSPSAKSASGSQATNSGPEYYTKTRKAQK